jgi:hypothetical protein
MRGSDDEQNQDSYHRSTGHVLYFSPLLLLIGIGGCFDESSCADTNKAPWTSDKLKVVTEGYIRDGISTFEHEGHRFYIFSSSSGLQVIEVEE